MAEDRTLVPETLTLRTLPDGAATGEGRYMMNRYLAERGDPEIRSNADVVAKSSFHDDPQFPDRRAARERQEQTKHLDMAERMARRFAVQQLVLQCMSLMEVDALAYPTSNLPPPKLGAPGEPAVNGRGNSWSSWAAKVSPRSRCRPASRPWSTTACAMPGRRSAPTAAMARLRKART